MSPCFRFEDEGLSEISKGLPEHFVFAIVGLVEEFLQELLFQVFMNFAHANFAAVEKGCDRLALEGRRRPDIDGMPFEPLLAASRESDDESDREEKNGHSRLATRR